MVLNQLHIFFPFTGKPMYNNLSYFVLCGLMFNLNQQYKRFLTAALLIFMGRCPLIRVYLIQLFLFNPYCIGAVVIIIASKTGNWDFGKLKGGDNEFHSLNESWVLKPDQTSKCVVLYRFFGHMVSIEAICSPSSSSDFDCLFKKLYFV